MNDHSPTLMAELLRDAKTIELPSGATVFQPGQVCDKFIFVTSGSVRVDLNSISGKAVMLYRIGPNQSCVMTTSCLMAGRDYAAEATAEIDTVARALSTQQFHEKLNASGDFRSLVFDTFTQRLGEMMAKVEQVAFSPIDQRLARRMVELQKSDAVISATHEQLALDLGSSREVISRKLARWEEAGYIARGHRSIELLNLQEITRLADLGD